MDLQELQKEVTYKVGRNLLLFQQMEVLLKYLVSHGTISAYHTQLLSKFEKRKQPVSKSTLGMNVGEFLSGSNPAPPPENLSEAHFEFRVDVEIEEERRSQIEGLVEERNHLVHHFLTDIDTVSFESWMAASNRLNLQEDKLTTAIEYLRGLAEELSRGRKALAEHMSTKEFEEWFKGA